MKKTLVIMGVSALALGMSACSYDHSPAPGHYESQQTSVSPNGTEVDSTKSTDVYYDANGRKKETTTTKTTDDPPGLFNKSTSESTQTETIH